MLSTCSILFLRINRSHYMYIERIHYNLDFFNFSYP